MTAIELALESYCYFSLENPYELFVKSIHLYALVYFLPKMANYIEEEVLCLPNISLEKSTISNIKTLSKAFKEVSMDNIAIHPYTSLKMFLQNGSLFSCFIKRNEAKGPFFFFP